MKLGDIFKKPDIEDDENINPRTLRGRMGDKMPKLRGAPVAPFGAGSSQAPFVPDWTPVLSPVLLNGLPQPCPSSALYRYSRASLVTSTNVTSYLSLYTSNAGGFGSMIGLVNTYIKVWPASPTSPISAQVANDTPPNTYLGGGFVLTQYSTGSGIPAWTIAVNPGEWISFCYEIVQPWPSGSANQKNFGVRFGPSPSSIPTNIQSVIFEYPAGCTWTPGFATPSPSPNWGDPNGTYA
jgi:hypothetical protein